MNHRRPNFDELTPDDLFRPEPVDPGRATGGTIAGEVLYSSREPLPQPWEEPGPPEPASGQPEYFGDVTSISPVAGPMTGGGPTGAPTGGLPPNGAGEASTQFLPPFPAAPVEPQTTEVSQWQPQPSGYGGGYPDQQGYPQQGYDQQLYDQQQQPQQPLSPRKQALQQQLQQQQFQQQPQPQQTQLQPQQTYGQQQSYGQPAPPPGYAGQSQPSASYGQQPAGGYGGGQQGGGGRPGGGRTSAGRRFSNRAIAVAAIVACAVVGVGAAALAAGGGGKSGTATAGSSVAPAGSAAPGATQETVQAQALSDLLATAANGRSAVIAAVGNVNGCQNLAQSQQDLTTAAGLRRQLIQQLDQLQTGALPHGAELVADLRQGWQASADADAHYASWADDSKATCAHTHKPKPGGELAEGDAASGTATTAKAKASKLWNIVAGATGMPKRTGSQL